MGRLLLLLVTAVVCSVTSQEPYSNTLSDEEEDVLSEYAGSGGDLEFFFSSMLEMAEENEEQEYLTMYKCIKCGSLRPGGCDVSSLRERKDIVQPCPGQCLNISSGNYLAYDCADTLRVMSGCSESEGMTMCVCVGDLCNAPKGLLPLNLANQSTGDVTSLVKELGTADDELVLKETDDSNDLVLKEPDDSDEVVLKEPEDGLSEPVPYGDSNGGSFVDILLPSNGSALASTSRESTRLAQYVDSSSPAGQFSFSLTNYLPTVLLFILKRVS